VDAPSSARSLDRRFSSYRRTSIPANRSSSFPADATSRFSPYIGSTGVEAVRRQDPAISRHRALHLFDFVKRDIGNRDFAPYVITGIGRRTTAPLGRRQLDLVAHLTYPSFFIILLLGISSIFSAYLKHSVRPFK